MAFRTADVQWTGDVRQGNGTIKLGSGAFEGPYSFQSRINETPQTNPEELLGAAHAGCFTMSLAATLGRLGHNPTQLNTTAKVHLVTDASGFTISGIDLTTQGTVPGIDQAAFQSAAEEAEKSCPLSKALTGTKITVTATLLSA